MNILAKRCLAGASVCLALTGLLVSGEKPFIYGVAMPSAEETEEDPEKEETAREPEEETTSGQETETETETEDPDRKLIRSMYIKPGLRIAVVSKNTRGEFWDTLREGMESEIDLVNDEKGFEKKNRVVMTFEGPSAEEDVNTQINTLDAVIAENPDVLCLCAGDVDSCLAQLEAARENGIPVITFDSDVSETELKASFCASDNRRIGEIAAEQMAEALEGKGRIAVFSAQSRAQSIQDRVSGFEERLADYDGMEIVRTIYMDEVENMNAAMAETLEEIPDLAGVFCNNADVTDLYLDLKKGETAPVLIGVDATSKQQKALKKGEEYGTVSQNASEIGSQTILTALSSLDPVRKTQLEKEQLLEPMWVDAENMEDETIQAYLY